MSYKAWNALQKDGVTRSDSTFHRANRVVNENEEGDHAGGFAQMTSLLKETKKATTNTYTHIERDLSQQFKHCFLALRHIRYAYATVCCNQHCCAATPKLTAYIKRRQMISPRVML